MNINFNYLGLHRAKHSNPPRTKRASRFLLSAAALAILLLLTPFQQAKAQWNGALIFDDSRNISTTAWNADDGPNDYPGYVYFKILVTDDCGKVDNHYLSRLDVYVNGAEITTPRLTGMGHGDGLFRVLNVLLNPTNVKDGELWVKANGYLSENKVINNTSNPLTWYSRPTNTYYTIPPENAPWNTDLASKSYNFARIAYYPYIEFESAEDNKDMRIDMKNIQAKWEAHSGTYTTSDKTKTISIPRPFRITDFSVSLNSAGQYVFSGGTNVNTTGAGIYNMSNKSAVVTTFGNGLNSYTHTFTPTTIYYPNGSIFRFRAKQNNARSRIYVYKDINLPTIAVFNGGLTVTNNYNGTLKLSWKTTNPSSTEHELAKGFVIQRSTDKGSTWTTLSGAPAYSNGTNEYEYTYNVPAGELGNGAKDYRFRISRVDMGAASRSEFRIETDFSMQTDYVSPESPVFDTTSRRIYFKINATGIKNDNIQFAVTKRANGIETALNANITAVPANDMYKLKGYDYWFNSEIEECKPTTYMLQTKVGSTLYGNAASIDVLYESAGKRNVTSFTVSKGYFQNKVDLKWTIRKDYNEFSGFRIYRTAIGSTKKSKVYDSPYTDGALELTATNNTSPGTFYKYELMGVASCAGEEAEYKMAEDLGYSQSFGSVSGKVTFTGTSVGVSNVEIAFKNQSENDNSGKNRALDFKEDATDSYLLFPTPYAYENNGMDGTPQLSFQMWARLHREKTVAGEAHQLLKGVKQWQETPAGATPSKGATLSFGKYPSVILGQEGEYTPTGVQGSDYIIKERFADNDITSMGNWYYKLEPVQWKVVDINGTKMTLLADKLLDHQPYHSTTQGSISWQNSLLRTWLNTGSGDGFLARAFTAEEQNALADASVLTDGVNTTDKSYLPTGNDLTAWGVSATGTEFTPVPKTVSLPPAGATPTYVDAVTGNITVTNTNNDGAGSLRQAINDVASGGRIVIDPALSGQTITLTSQISFNKSLTIEGNGITITTSGMTGVSRGTIRINGGTVTLNRIRFSKCELYDYGGALYCSSGANLNLNSCIFDENKTLMSSAQGGAIDNESGTVKIQGCTFYKNTTGSYGGGAIYNFKGLIHVTGNIFYGNTATGNGNTVRNNEPLSGCTSNYNIWDNNTGTTSFYFTGNDTQKTSLNFSASDYAPAGTDYNILPATLPTGFPTTDFYGYARTGDSAAGAALKSLPQITAVTATTNTGAGSLRWAIASVAAGGKVIISPALTQAITLTSKIEFSKSLTIEGNSKTITTSGMQTATWGTIRITGGTVTLNRIRFSKCVLQNYGGALSCNGSGTNLTLNSCIFDENKTTATTAQGGAIDNQSGTVKIQGCTFYNNTTGSTGGGAIYSYAGHLTLTGNIFYGNTATSNGNTVRRNPTNSTSSFEYNILDNNTGGILLTFKGRQLTSLPVKATSPFVPNTDAVNVLPNIPIDGFPTTDFYGATRNRMAGAVQGLEQNRFYWLRNTTANKAAVAREIDGVNAAGEFVDMNGFIRPVITLDLDKDVRCDSASAGAFNVKTDADADVVMRDEPQVEVTVDHNNKLNIKMFGKTLKWDSEADTLIKQGVFFHLTGALEKINLDDWAITPYINGVKLDQKIIEINNEKGSALFFNRAYVSGTGKRHFEGVVDELRIWNARLSDAQIKNNCRRYIPSSEPGLVGYYRFDEPDGAGNDVYDLSNQDGDYNENHGSIVGDASRHGNDVPTTNQLALKAVTDDNGNYTSGMILPFINSGTAYLITPLLGVHQFTPSNRQRTLSSGEPAFSGVDFTDDSRFTYNGSVVYSGGDFPVEGCTFLIDGAQQNTSDGTAVTSDSKGEFSLQVPVGTHTIKVVKQGHTFAKDTITRNFQDHELAYMARFHDLTRIRVVGRVVGGTVESSKPLGFGKSENNVGSSRILLQAVKSNKFLDNPKDTVFQHWNKTSQSEVQYDGSTITIRTDDETGEFFADVYPENYSVMSIKYDTDEIIDGVQHYEEDYLKDVSLQWDLRNKVTASAEVQTYLTRKWNETTIPNPQFPDLIQVVEHIDSIACNDTLVYTHRVAPVMRVIELDEEGKDKYLDPTTRKVPYYGEKNFVYYKPSTTGGTPTEDHVDLVWLDNDDKAEYQFRKYVEPPALPTGTGYPVYSTGKLYRYRVSVQESYTNWQNDKSYDVPVAGEYIQVTNPMGDVSGNQRFQLDSLGHYVYDNLISKPNTSSGDAYIEFAYPCITGSCPNVRITAIVLGGENTGTNFTTQAPDKVLFVLRDPPGANSYAYWETENTIVQTKGYTFEQQFNLGTMVMAKLGATQQVITLAGVGVAVGTETKIEVISDLGAGVYVNESFNKEGKWESTFTFKKRVETSADPDWVGADADVFVGTSMNLLYGYSNMIQLGDTDAASNFETRLFRSRDAKYDIGNNSGITVGEKFGTTFHYTQRMIRETLIPEWKNLIRNLLTYSSTEPSAPAKVPIYYSKLQPTDPNYGSLNDNGAADGTSYKIIYPELWSDSDKLGYTDSVKYFNLQIKGWEKTLAYNEQAKVNAMQRKAFNYSFSDGVLIDYSSLQNDLSEVSESAGGGITQKIEVNHGFGLSEAGIQFKVEENIQVKGMGSTGSSNSESKTQGFVLNTSNKDNKFTVDIHDGVGLQNMGITDSIIGSFIFLTKGGQSSCPYEGGDVTRYYEPGTPLNTATMRNEVPRLQVITQNTVSGVPADGKAEYRIRLLNNSESKVDGWYNLRVNSASNPYSAVVRIDGDPITEKGMPVYVPYGSEGVMKTVTIERGPSQYQYDNIELVMASQCQYYSMDEEADIFAVEQLSAYFLQGCSDIMLAEPQNYWIMNTENETSDQLKIEVSGFNKNFANLEWIELQMKESYASKWEQLEKYDKDAISNSNGRFSYNWNMKDLVDANYDVRAVAICEAGGQVIAKTTSPAYSGVKDMVRPQPFGRPQPRDGVLDVEDEIMIQFNEPIAAGRVTAGNATLQNRNIYVTGVKSEAQGSFYHPASVHLAGNQTLTTQNDVTLTAPFTVEAWVRIFDAVADGNEHVIFSHGDKFRISIRYNTMYVYNGDNTPVAVNISEAFDPTSATWNPEWAHIAVTYMNDGKVTGYYAVGSKTVPLDGAFAAPIPPYSETGRIAIGNKVAGNAGITADIHDLRVWSTAKTPSMYSVYNGAESNLKHYWRLDEAQGTTAADRAGGLTASLGNASWTIAHPGKSVSIPSTGNLTIPASSIAFSATNDFAVEFWFKGAGAQADTATLFSAGCGDGQDLGGGQKFFDSSDKLSIFFDKYRRLTLASNGSTHSATSINYLDDKWHHLALSVNRLGDAVMYVDGNAVIITPASNIGGMVAPNFYLGQRGYYKGNLSATEDFRLDRQFVGSFDEVRIWNAALDAEFIKDNKNVRIDTAHTIGLAAYYPFDEYGLQDGSPVVKSSLKDLSPKESTNVKSDSIKLISAIISDDYAPVKMEGPNQDLGFKFVVNNDKILITLTEPRNRIERSLITIKVDGVQDLNGNKQGSAVIWTALVNQTQLRWSQKELLMETQPQQQLTKTVAINNMGGTAQSWTISGIPTWLQVTPSSGTLAAQGTQNITIKSLASTAAGSYEQTLLLNGTSTDQITVNLKVKAAAPAWTVNPNNYEQNASVVANLLINDIYSTDTDDKLAVFVGDECRGVANVTYEPAFGRYVVYLTVYSNNDFQNDAFVYRIWDSKAGVERQAITTASLDWKGGYSFGSVNLPITFKTTSVTVDDIMLAQGWTWLSLNKSQEYMLVDSVFGSVREQAIILKSQDSLATPDNSSWRGSLKTVNNTAMYKIRMDVASVLRTAGTPVNTDITLITVKPNWNWIAYTAQGVQSVTQAFSGLQPQNGDLVKDQTSFATYNNGSWSGSLTSLAPGKGYIYMSKAEGNKTFSYPQVAAPVSAAAPLIAPLGVMTMRSRAFGAAETSETIEPFAAFGAFGGIESFALTAADSEFNPVPSNTYSDNMSVIAIVKNGNDTLTNVELGAFIGMECRGAQKSEADGLIFLTISGESGNSIITFKVHQLGGAVIDVAQTLTYNSDAIEGTVAKPYIIQVSPPAPTIITNALLDGLVNAEYRQTLVATGFMPIDWSIIAGTLPAGLDLNPATGEIWGTPTTDGKATFTVKANNTAGSVTKELSIMITASSLAPSISTSALFDGTIGTAYRQTLAATGSAPIIWSIVDGALPAGLQLDENTGEIWGTPTTSETATFIVRARNIADYIEKTLSIKVTAAPVAPSISTVALLDGITGTEYRQTLVATGSATITWDIAEGALPAGLQLSTTGEIWGTPTTEGLVSFTVKAINPAGNVTKTLSIRITTAPVAPNISTITLLDGAVGTAYSQTLAATGTAPISWEIADGSALPAGLTLDKNTGEIWGKPTTDETVSFTVKASNPARTVEKSLSIKVNAAPVAPSISTSTLPDGILGTQYSQTLVATGTATIEWSIDGGALPAGLTLNRTTGEISGKPTTVVTATFSVKAINPAGNVTKTLTIKVTATPIVPSISTVAPLTGGIVGKAYSQTLIATGSAPINWSIVGEPALPAGLKLDSITGEISGTPLTAAAVSLNVKASNVAGYVTKTLPITIIFLNVQFDSRNGNAVASQALAYGKKASEPATPTRAGYAFGGWYKDVDGISKWNFANDVVTSDITLYAKWTMETYAITYNVNGGSVIANGSYTVDSPTLTLPTPPTRDGYTFDKWYDNAAFSGTPVTSIPKGSTGDREYWAKWKVVTYTVKYYGSTLPDSSYTVESEAITLPTPTREGYTFDGWSNNVGIKITDIAKGSTGNREYWAKWSAEPYTITYNVNGGSAIFNGEYTIESSAITLPTPTREGYKFDGWYNNVGLTGSSVVSIAKGSTDNREYWAKWTVVTYYITYNVDGGLAIAKGSYTVDSATITLPTPTRVGYTFDGWFNNVGIKITDIAKGSTGDREYWAKWAAVQYVITYNVNGGSAIAPGEYTISSAITLPTPTREGYKFDGWYNNVGLTGSPVVSIAKGSTDNREYWAKWTPVQYAITYNVNGGSAIANSSYTVDSTTITLPTPTRVGYDFEGWYENVGLTGSSVASIATGSTGARKYWANWTTVTYDITYNVNGGSAIAPGEYTISSAITLPTPTREGYKFVGWYNNVGLTGSSVVSIAKGNTDNREYWAKWTPIPYTIKYRVNGGTAISDGSYNIESPVITLPTPIRNIHDFDGWYDNAGLGGTPETDIATGSTGNREYWAKWKIHQYTVTFNSQSGSAVAPQTVDHGARASTPINPILDGKILGGWYKEAACTNVWNFSTDIVTSDVTLYAKWTSELLQDAEIVTLEVNGIPVHGTLHGRNLTYQADCGENTVDLKIKASDNAVIRVNNAVHGESTTVALTGDLTEIYILVRSESGVIVKEYNLTVSVPLDSRIYFQRWDNMLAINHNPANNGGYNVTAVRWFKDGALISQDKFIKYEQGNEYRAEVEVNGVWHKVCPYTTRGVSQSIVASPNPIQRGESLLLQVPESFVGGTLSIYSIAGTLVKTGITLPTTLSNISVADIATGIYLLKISSANGASETVKIIVE